MVCRVINLEQWAKIYDKPHISSESQKWIEYCLCVESSSKFRKMYQNFDCLQLDQKKESLVWATQFWYIYRNLLLLTTLARCATDIVDFEFICGLKWIFAHLPPRKTRKSWRFFFFFFECRPSARPPSRRLLRQTSEHVKKSLNNTKFCDVPLWSLISVKKYRWLSLFVGCSKRCSFCDVTQKQQNYK